MPLFVKARSFLRNLFLSRGVEVDLDQEIHSHLEMLIAENTRAGMPPEEAQRAARIELGGIEQVKEQVREEGLGNWLHSVLSDCRYGLRQLRKNPGATAVMVFTLALAIGAATAIFSVVYGVLLRPLPYIDAKKGAGRTVLVSYGYWRQQLGSPQDFSQAHLKIDGAVYSVIGVLPDGFRFPADVDLWLPTDLDGENRSRTAHNYFAVGHLRDGVTVEQANQDISAIARRIHETSSEQGDYLLKDGIVLPLQDSITGKARPALLVLLGAVGFLLLVACANLANLLLAHAWVRERELAIRSALGAARGRLSRQFLTEALGLSMVRAGVGVLGALWGGAGLLGRSLMKVLEVNAGLRVNKIVTMDVALPWVYWSDLKAKAVQAICFSNLSDRLKQIPGVRKVGATSGLPLMDGGLPNGMFLLMTQNEMPKTLDGFDALGKQKERLGSADFGVATDGYFQVLGIPVIRGRMFDERDGPNSPHVAVISESLARDQWPNQDPIGHTIEFGNMDGDLRLLTIVGIVGDTHEYGLDAPPRPTVYVNLFQRPRSAITLTMLSDADTGSVTSAARGTLQNLNPEIPARFRTFSQVYSASLGSRRFNVILIGFFGIVALLLATAGVFGVMAYSVSLRTREIGVRVALGARSGDVLRMVLSQGLRTIFIGVAIGIAGSLALTRTVESLLFGVTATDPLTFGGVTLLLVGAALLACWIPARRATQRRPLVAPRFV